MDKGLPVVGRRIEVAELSSASAFVSEAGSGSHCPAFGRTIKRPFKNASTFEVKRLGVLIKTSKRFCFVVKTAVFSLSSPGMVDWLNIDTICRGCRPCQRFFNFIYVYITMYKIYFMLYTLPYIGYEKGWQGRQPRQKYPLVSFRAKRRISITPTLMCPRSFTTFRMTYRIRMAVPVLQRL